MRNRTRVTAPLAAAALLAMAAPAARAQAADAGGTGAGGHAPDTGAPGAGTVGDPVFPTLGNGGYRADAYLLDFTYDPATKLIAATATINARATQDLSQFSLDCLGLDIGGVEVDGRPATYVQEGEKLVITPKSVLCRDRRFDVRVEYGADPRRSLPRTGWVPTPDGFAIAGQPDVAHTVFPCNDHPSDKAHFRFRVTVPDGLLGVASGRLVSTVRHGDGLTTFTYQSREPIATEIVQITVGDYIVKHRQGPGGLPLRDIVPTSRAEALEPALALTPGLVTWLEQYLGAFPFETYGLLPANTDDPNAFDFTGLETQTLTLYKPNYLLQPESAIGSHMMHELVHSWFGNLVSPGTWSDLWINEGHADFYGLIYRYERGWADSRGFTTLEDRMKYTYALGDQWRQSSGPVAAPNATNLWDNQRYTGGVLVLYALRRLVGEDAFHSTERTFLNRFRNKSATTDDYIAVASEVSGQDLTGFLRDWLYGTTTPRMPGHPDWTVTPVTPSVAAPRHAAGQPHDAASATL